MGTADDLSKDGETLGKVQPKPCQQLSLPNKPGKSGRKENRDDNGAELHLHLTLSAIIGKL